MPGHEGGREGGKGAEILTEAEVDRLAAYELWRATKPADYGRDSQAGLDPLMPPAADVFAKLGSLGYRPSETGIFLDIPGPLRGKINNAKARLAEKNREADRAHQVAEQQRAVEVWVRKNLADLKSMRKVQTGGALDSHENAKILFDEEYRQALADALARPDIVEIMERLEAEALANVAREVEIRNQLSAITDMAREVARTGSASLRRDLVTALQTALRIVEGK